MPCRIAAGRPGHASMISIKSASPLRLSWKPRGARVCLFGTIGSLSRPPRAPDAGLKFRCCADEEFAIDVRTFNERRRSPPTARTAVLSSMSSTSPVSNHRRQRSSATAPVTKSTSTKSSGSGFEGSPERHLTGPSRNDRCPYCPRAPCDASVDLTEVCCPT
jgi:hypothetical protein